MNGSNEIMKRDKGNALKSLGGLYYFLVPLMICVLLFMVSCINEINYKQEDPSSEIKSFSLFIPKNSNPFSTRNNGLNKTEGNINTLWVCAFPIDENSGETKVIEISHFKESNPLKEGYDQYKLELKEGRYNIYVLANIEKYLNSFRLNSSIGEEDLKSLVLNFSEVNYLQSGNLPLISFGEDICYGENKTKATEAGVPITDNTIIYANLQFLCAKVRFTILFDNTPSGFSTAFEKIDIDFNSTIKISNIITDTPLFRSYLEDETFNIETELLKRVDYPVQGSEYFDIENKGSNLLQDLTPLQEGTGSESNQKAWQGIVYLPENLTANITQLYFTAQGSEVITDQYYYSIKASGNSEEANIKRGNFYDIVVKIKNKTQFEDEIEFNISDWNLENLYYLLHGPYELEIEKTNINVSSDSWSETIWLKTNISPENIEFQFPEIEIGGELLPLYTAELIHSLDPINGQIVYSTDSKGNYLCHVKINSKIPYFSISGKDLSDYNYFYIKVGNIYKQISVEDFSILPFLTINPVEINLEMIDYLLSGKDSDIIDIVFETNLYDSPIEIISRGEEILNQNNGLIGLEDFNNFLSEEDGIYHLSSNKGSLQLRISNLFEGKNYWHTSHNYSVVFGISPGNGEEKIEKTLNITFTPYNYDYVIHFKNLDKENEWDDPHVYVYQNLHLPFNIQGINSSFSGKTVGYKSGTEYFIAPEYVFTNNITFKGWKNYGGIIDPNVEHSQFENGLVFLGGVDSQESNNFNPTSHSLYYNYEISYNYQHYGASEDWVCKKCISEANLNQGGERTYPGIAMQPEFDEDGNKTGWWKYTLSGVASSNQAYIVFSNGHDYNIETKMYPDDYQNGIPLFNFRNNEGWLLYDPSATEQYFTDSKPYEESEPSQPEEPDDWVEGVASGIYFLSNENNFSVNSNHQFYTASIKNQLCLKDKIFIDAGDQFILFDSISNVYYGINNGKKYDNASDSNYLLEIKESSNSGNRVSTSNFNGNFNIILKKVDNTYLISFEK